jgi:hypothetical protein
MLDTAKAYLSVHVYTGSKPQVQRTSHRMAHDPLMTPELFMEMPFVTLQAEKPSGPCHLPLHLPVVLHFYVQTSLGILQDKRPLLQNLPVLPNHYVWLPRDTTRISCRLLLLPVFLCVDVTQTSFFLPYFARVVYFVSPELFWY